MAGWTLEPTERVVWDGCPRPTPWTGREALGLAVCASVPALGAMALVAALGGGIGWTAPLAGLVTLAAGLILAAGALAVIRWRDRRTRYALTDRRVLLARPGFGLRMGRHSGGWPLADLDGPRLRRHGDGSISLIFPRGAGAAFVALRRVPPGQGLMRALRAA